MVTRHKRLIAILVSVPLLLLIPLIAMQLSDEVNWSASDFVIMGILLLTVGLVSELVWRKVGNARHRIIALLVVLGLFLLVWAELAVGIFGTPFAGS